MKPRFFSVRWYDRLLFPVALLFVVFEAIFRSAARFLLAALASVPGMASARAMIGRLPARVVLPLFLVPEAISHLTGFFATYLFARGQFAFAVALVVIVKGGATLATVWIYQAAAPTLLAVPWFARGHDWFVALKQWTLALVAPTREAFSRFWHSRQPSPNSLAGQWLRRFRVLRTRLEAWLIRPGAT